MHPSLTPWSSAWHVALDVVLQLSLPPGFGREHRRLTAEWPCVHHAWAVPELTVQARSVVKGGGAVITWGGMSEIHHLFEASASHPACSTLHRLTQAPS
jgi:hypothetical protein